MVEQNQIEHCSHKHPLILCDLRGVDEKVNFYGCNNPIQASPSTIYSLKACNSYLHKSCSELPTEMKRPYHPPHTLYLHLAWRQHNCTFCHSAILGFSFCCDICKFYLDARCATRYLTVKFEDKVHLYFLKEAEFNTIYHSDMCTDIGMDTNLFRCVIPSCFRSFQFHCSPFPWSEMIKSKCHFRPLTFAEIFLEDDLGKYYCDASKTERNPKHTVYRCMQCDCIAHVSCTISEVLPSILAEYEMDAKLRENLANDAGIRRLNMKIRGAL